MSCVWTNRKADTATSPTSAQAPPTHTAADDVTCVRACVRACVHACIMRARVCACVRGCMYTQLTATRLSVVALGPSAARDRASKSCVGPPILPHHPLVHACLHHARRQAVARANLRTCVHVPGHSCGRAESGGHGIVDPPVSVSVWLACAGTGDTRAGVREHASVSAYACVESGAYARA